MAHASDSNQQATPLLAMSNEEKKALESELEIERKAASEARLKVNKAEIECFEVIKINARFKYKFYCPIQNTQLEAEIADLRLKSVS